jgi:predicted alpha/beta superfamily hydrolase
MKIRTTYLSFLLVFIIRLLSDDVAAQNWPGIRDSIYSETLKEKRIIQVIMPKDYKAESGEKYEVLYVLDGEWYMEQVPFIYNFAMNSGYVPKCIFVLIPNTYVNSINLRDRDFSPTRINMYPQSGGADNFHAFLKNELIPYVEKKYPANGQKSLLGSSFSGLFAVYAFVKEPQLFQSYIASDPNLNWDNGYVSKLAGEKLPHFSEVSATLFIAGLNRSFHDMGDASMDSVLRAKAPGSIHWKCEIYSNETHYSVQHKAFYDGMRFSHLGYSDRPAEYHPMNGILLKDKSLKIYVLQENPAVHYTSDGTGPTSKSPVLSRDSAIVVTAPAQFRIKSFSNRPLYDRGTPGNIIGNFSVGEPLPPDSKSKRVSTVLSYNYFKGEWNKLPDFNSLKPAGSGVVDKDFIVNQTRAESNSAYLIQGSIEAPEEGYYVFYVNSENGAKLYIGGKLIIDIAGIPGSISQSYVVPLKKGIYSVRLELLRKKDAHDIQLLVFRTKTGNDDWWKTQFLKL